MTDRFKEKCKQPAYHDRLGKIIYDNDKIITESDYLKQFSIDDACITNGTIVGSIYAKSITINTLKVYDLTDKSIDVQIGIEYDENSTEYINMGKYTIQRETNVETAKIGQYKGLDNLRLLDQKYVCGITDFTSVTIKDFLQDLCTQLGLVLGTQSFTNDAIPVKGNPFTNNETCRDALKAVLLDSLCFAVIDIDNSQLLLKWLENDVSETFSKDDYNALTKNNAYGPINCLVLRDSTISGENVVREDKESIALHGENQFIIEEPYFLYTEELRNLAIDNIWNKVKGLTYVDCKITTSLGKPYLKVGQKISVEDDEGNYFDTYVLKHQFTYDGTFYSVIESPALTKEEEKRKNTTDIKTRFLNTERSINKIDGEIKDIIQEQTDTTERLNETISTLDQTKQTISKVETTVEDITTTTQTSIGENDLYLTDALESNAIEYHVAGKCVQETSTEYNLISKQGLSTPKSDTEFWENVGAYCTPLSDGWCRQNFDGNQTTRFSNSFVKASAINAKPDTQYTLFVEVRNSTNNLNVALNDVAQQGMFANNKSLNAVKDGVYKMLFTTVSDLSGKVLRIYTDSTTNTKIASVEYRVMLIEGDHTTEELVYQAFTPNSPSPEYPSEIQSIGTNGVLQLKILGSTPDLQKNLELTLKNNEICSVESIVDQLDIVDNDMSLNKKVGKIILNGSETWARSTTASGYRYRYLDSRIKLNDSTITVPNIICSHFKTVSPTDTWNSIRGITTLQDANGIFICYEDSSVDTLDKFKGWLLTNPITIYYELAEPQIVELGNIDIPLYDGINHVQLISDLETSTSIKYLRKTPLSEDYATNQSLQHTNNNLSQTDKNLSDTDSKLTNTTNKLNNDYYDKNQIDFIKSTTEEQITTIKNSVEQLQTSTDIRFTFFSEKLINGITSVTTETGYTFNKDGLHISKAGEEMSSRIDNTGLYVDRGITNILTANHGGVVAENLWARKFIGIENVYRQERTESLTHPGVYGVGFFDLGD